MTTATITKDALPDELAEQMQILVDEVTEIRRLRESLSEMVSDLAPVARQSLDSLTLAMAKAETVGYLSFARSGMGVVDRVVTSFSEEDVEALGDNIVLILETVKEMTQPEIMELTRSTFHGIHDIDVPDEPPSTLQLVRQFRDPDVRRGMARLGGMLKSLGSTTPQERKEGSL